MKAVSNASPLIFLGKLGQLGLLLKLYEQVTIPQQVYQEVVVAGRQIGAPEADAVDFLIRHDHIQVAQIAVPNPEPAWAGEIHAGETAAIRLCQQLSADLLLLDDARARSIARQCELTVKGTAGVLLDAFRRGFLTLAELELQMHTIQERSDIWIGDRLCRAVVEQARREVRKADS